MSDQRNLFDPRIADWLEDGPDTAPSIVLDSLAAALPSIPQRHSWRQLRRYSEMPRFAVAGVAVVVVLALTAALFMSRLNAPAPAASPTTAATSNSPSQEPTPAQSRRPAPTAPGTPEANVIAPADVGRILPAGTYDVDGFAVPFTVTLADRWQLEEFNDNNVVISDTNADDPLYNIGFLVVDKVYADPCTAAGGATPVVSGVAGLVSALSGMTGFEVRNLRDVSVGGAPGKAFTLTNAVDTETQNCVGGSPWLWIGTYEKAGSDELIRTISGAIDPFWVVDAGGTTVLIAPGIRDGSPANIAAAEALVDGISFPDSAPGEPSPDPSANRIAFVAECEINGEIYSMNADGSDVVNLTNSDAADSMPAWSPDRTRIAFTSLHEENGVENFDIYVMDADGSNVVRLTDHPAEDSAPAWSPDGTKIVFGSTRGSGGIFTIDADGSDVVRLIDGGFPSWSPDGERIALQISSLNQAEILTMNADGSVPIVITTGSNFDAEAPAWSPDGTRIAFQGGGGVHWDIYTMGADGSDVARLTSEPPSSYGPSWSPDGTRIAFHRADGIYTMLADGSDVVRLTNNMGCVVSPSW